MTEYLGEATSLWCPELAPVALLSDAAGPADGKASSVNTRCAAHLPRKSFGLCPSSEVDACQACVKLWT